VFDRLYEQFLDIGSAEGYYAVGLARHFPEASVHAFDTDRWARRMSRLMAERNGVDNLTVHGACTTDWVRENVRPETFILSDCEGFEDQLLDPQKAPVLRQCDLLVELHETPAPGVTERMAKRFGGSHDLTLIDSQESDPSAYPGLQGLSEEERTLAVSDLRTEGRQQWLYAEAN